MPEHQHCEEDQSIGESQPAVSRLKGVDAGEYATITAEAMNMLEERFNDNIAEVKRDIAEVKRDVAEVKSDISEVKHDIARLDMKIEVKTGALDRAVAAGFSAMMTRLDEIT